MPSNLGMVMSRRKRLPSEGNAEDSLSHASSLVLNHPTLTHQFRESGLEPFFATLGGEVSYNRSKGDGEQEERAEMDSEVMYREPSSVPNFSSCQSHAGSLHACPEHCLLNDELGSGPFHDFVKLTEFSLGKWEMEGCP